MADKIAICVGNGPSRKNINIHRLLNKLRFEQPTTIIGTNFFYKETNLVDYIVAWDKEAAIIGMKEFMFTSMIIPDPESRSKLHSNSGLYAIHWAATNLGVKRIFLIGFDHLNANCAGETLTDEVIRKNQEAKNKDYSGMSPNNTMSKESSKIRGNYLRDTIKKFPEIEFTAFLPPRIVLHSESPPNLKRKLVDKKYMKKVESVSLAGPSNEKSFYRICDAQPMYDAPRLKINPVC